MAVANGIRANNIGFLAAQVWLTVVVLSRPVLDEGDLGFRNCWNIPYLYLIRNKKVLSIQGLRYLVTVNCSSSQALEYNDVQDCPKSYSR
jgi:hypothetical protein